MTLPLVHRGKVRDAYDAGEGRLLMVTSDRISAFDVVMFEPIPDKGRVLTAMTVWWLHEVADIVPNHLLSTDVADLPAGANDLDHADDLPGRVMLVRRAQMLTIECIVRGYLSGSAWKEYRQSGTVHGMSAAPGLQESQRLPEPMFTPSTKEGTESGHDENLSVDQAADLVGADVVKEAAHISLAVYQRAADIAAERGIIVADTKFELGWIDGRLTLCDEVLTPDSSRFWDAATYQVATTPPSFDKQPLRDWLDASGWDHSPPPPPLPPEVVTATSERYVRAYERLTGLPWSAWSGVGQ